VAMSVGNMVSELRRMAVAELRRRHAEAMVRERWCKSAVGRRAGSSDVIPCLVATRRDAYRSASAAASSSCACSTAQSCIVVSTG